VGSDPPGFIKLYRIGGDGGALEISISPLDQKKGLEGIMYPLPLRYHDYEGHDEYGYDHEEQLP